MVKKCTTHVLQKQKILKTRDTGPVGRLALLAASLYNPLQVQPYRPLDSMQLFAFGINHQTAPLSVREQIAFNPEAMESALQNLIAQGAAKEATILSTCNRMEVYCSTQEPEQIVNWLAHYHQMESRELEPYLYTLSRDEAVKPHVLA